MFSVRTTLGAITIIIADAIICYLAFMLTFFPLFDIPEWLGSKQIVLSSLIVFMSS